MTTRFFSAFSLLTFLFSFSVLLAQSGDDFTWKLEKEVNNAQVYLKYNAQNQAIACKIITELNVPISESLPFLSNFDNFQKWVNNYYSSATMHNVPGKEMYGYVLIKTQNPEVPVIDAILHFTFQQTTGGWIGTINAMPDYKARSLVMPRLEQFAGMWALQDLGAANSKFTYLVEFHPTKTAVETKQVAESHLTTVLNLQQVLGGTVARLN